MPNSSPPKDSKRERSPKSDKTTEKSAKPQKEEKLKARAPATEKGSLIKAFPPQSPKSKTEGTIKASAEKGSLTPGTPSPDAEQVRKDLVKPPPKALDPTPSIEGLEKLSSPPLKEGGEKGAGNKGAERLLKVTKEKAAAAPQKAEKKAKTKPPFKQRAQVKLQKVRKKLREKAQSAKNKLLGRDARGKPIQGTTEQIKPKQLLSIYIVFLLYNLLFIVMANTPDPEAPLVKFGYIVTLNQPYVFGNALTFSFIASAVLLSVNIVRKVVLKKWYFMLVFFLGLFAVMFLAAGAIIGAGYYMVPFLLILSTMWLIFQSAMYYAQSRGFATKIETRFVERYSKIRVGIALFTPIFFVGLIVFMSWIYRFWWVTVALDVTAGFNPTGSLNFYSFLMSFVVPAIYFIVILITLFMVLEFVLTMKRGETRTAGLWDNFAFALMSFFLFIWMLFMVTLYLLLTPQGAALWKGLFISGEGTSGNTGLYALIAEFAISMIFLYMIIGALGKAFGWRVFFFQKDGLVFIFLSIIMAQSISRFAIFTGLEAEFTQQSGILNTILTADRLIIPMFLVVLLGATVLIYYLRPQKMSMFMRREKEAMDEADRAKEIVLKFLRREFIRKGKKFRVDSIDNRLSQLLGVPNGVVHSLITRLSEEYVDIILEEEIADGVKVKYIDFIPITERYQDSAEAEVKARQHLTQQLAGSLKSKTGDRQRILIKTKKRVENQQSAVAGDLINTLQSSFAKQAREKKIEEAKGKTVDFKKDLKEDSLEILAEFLRNEYLFRAQHPEEFVHPSMKMLDIAGRVEEITGINPAELYPILEILTLQNPNFLLKENAIEPANKIIDFNPITDIQISDALEKANPESLFHLRVQLWKMLMAGLRTLRGKILEPIEKLDVPFDPSFKQLLRSLQKSWQDPKHPRLHKPDLAKLTTIVGKLMPKNATGWKEYVFTKRPRQEPAGVPPEK